MPTRTAKASNATFAYAAKAGQEFIATARDRLRVDSGDAEVFLRFSNPVPEDEQAVAAYLEVTAEDVWAGSRTLTARGVDAPSGAYRDLNWNNRPAAASGSVASAVTQAGTTRLWRFPVTLDVATGKRTLDFRITSDDTTTRWLKGLRSANGFPRLVVTTQDRPVAPEDVTPDGIVGVAAPVLQWSEQEDVDMVRAEVGTVDANGDWLSTSWASADIESEVGMVDLATAGYGGVANLNTVYARVAQRVPAGWSAWSEPVTLQRLDKPALTVLSPGPTTADATFPIVWEFPGQAAWKVTVEYPSQSKPLSVTSRKRTGTDGTWTPPDAGADEGDVIRVTVRTWDGEDRAGSPGDPEYQEVTVETVFTPVDTVAPMSSLTAWQVGEGPAVRLGWSRLVGVPDEVVVRRDGVLVSRAAGGDLEVLDYTAPPNRDLTYTARAVVNGEASEELVEIHARTSLTGLWLIDPETGRSISLAGDDLSYSFGEVSTVYTPARAASVIRRTLALRGAEGTFAGVLDPREGRTEDDLLDDLWWMRERPQRRLRLVVGDLNIPVVVSGLFPTLDTARSRTSEIRHLVSFSFAQDGELPFEAI